MRIADIQIGERHRKDMGDLESLAQSIAEVGLLHPVVVTPDARLIAGERRIRACLMLGWTDIPATVVDLPSIIRGECDENQKRKDWTPTEAVAIAKELEPLEREAARERQGARNDKLPVDFTGGSGAAMDKVADAVGMSRPTLEQEPVPNGTPETVAGAERRGGEILREVERSPGARTDLTSSQPVTRFQGAVEDAGLDRMTARRWQIIAAMPVESFEQHIAQMKARAPTGESPQLRPPHARKGAACAKCAKGGPPHARAGISPGLVCEMSEGVRHVRGEIVGRNTAKTAKG